MQKKITLGLLLAMFILNMQLIRAQNNPIPDGTIIPNYVLTDIDGNKHDLYSYLDSGQKLLLYFMTTHDISVASYGFGNIFPSFWTLFGPEGTNEFMVLMIEVDPATGIDDINGETDNTQMDWNAAADFPIINSDTLNQLFNISLETASTYVLCQNRTTINADNLSYAKIYEKAQKCPEPQTQNDVSLLDLLIPIEISCENYFAPEIVLQNEGFDPLQSVIVETIVDGILNNSFEWSGNLPLYYTDTVQLPIINNMVKGNHEIEFHVKLPNGAEDLYPSDNTSSTIFTNNPNGALTNLQILSDWFPTEIHFSVYKGDSLVFTFTPELVNNEYNLGLCLDNGENYLLKIEDESGDGFQAGNMGSCVFTYKNDTLVTVLGDEFSYEYSKEFVVPELQTESQILAFSVNNQVENTLIDAENKKVIVKVSDDADLSSLVSSFELSKYATAFVNDSLQQSGETINDFNSPVEYTIHAEDGSSSMWTVEVLKASSYSLNLDKQLKIYPNPTKGIVMITSDQNIRKVKVYTLSGVVQDVEFDVLSKTINLSELENGSYYISVDIENNIPENFVIIKQ